MPRGNGVPPGASLSLWTYTLIHFTEIIQLVHSWPCQVGVSGGTQRINEYISQRRIIRLAYRIQSGESNSGHLHTEESEDSVNKAR